MTRVIDNTVYHFVGSNLVVEIFLKKREHQKKGRLEKRTEAPLYTFYWGFKTIPSKAYLLFYCFLVIKRILKALFSFIPWPLNSSDLPSYGSNLRERYTPRLLSMWLGRSTPPFHTVLGVKLPLSLDPLFVFLRWASFSLAFQ